MHGNFICIYLASSNTEDMTIHEKINAKGNRLVFYTARDMSKLIKRDYYQPNQNINLPDRLYLKSQYLTRYH